MAIGLACFIVFLVMAGAMYTRRISSLMALPLMALMIAIIGGIPAPDILSNVIGKGATKLNVAYTTTMFGAMLAELMNRLGIAKSFVRYMAEFAGDSPFLLGTILTAVTALLFSTLGGLGAVIMVGTIVLPILLSIGISNVAAGCLLLFGISIGGMFNLATWQVYIDLLGIKPQEIIGFVVPLSGVMAILVITFLGIELKKLRNIGLALAAATAIAFLVSLSSGSRGLAPGVMEATNRLSLLVVALLFSVLMIWAFYRHVRRLTSVPGLALITPFIPLSLVLICHWDIIPAFVAGIAYATLSTWQRNSINLLTRSILDGVANVVPAVVLMVGIGILYTAVTDDKLKTAMAPALAQIIPTHAMPYVAIFTIAAPLALYRGPLNVFGLGSGLAALISKATTLSSQALFGMLMSVGQIQGICDPTNTQNIWVANYLGIDTKAILARALPFAWIGVLSGLSLATLFGYVPW